MAGDKRKGMVIQERDKHLLRELALMRVVDREQTKIINGFGSTTRANARLLALVRAGLLRRFFLGTNAGGTKALYALSAKGAELVDVPLRGPQRRKDETLAADFFIQHQLTVNELYCGLKYRTLPQGITFERWESFFSPVVPELKLIPDGYVQLQTPSGIFAAFLEVDLGHERGSVWREKIENYLSFAVSENPIGKSFSRPFLVLVVVPTERRLRSIRTIIRKKTERIFLLASLEAIRHKSLFAPIWFRPTGNSQEPLIQELT
jgi:protein involved in plasmid replication-relaxation